MAAICRMVAVGDGPRNIVQALTDMDASNQPPRHLGEKARDGEIFWVGLGSAMSSSAAWLE